MSALFDPQKPLLELGRDAPAFTQADATTGVAVFGATGSGKTSGPGALLARAYLRAGFGGLILCSKVNDDRQQWEEWAGKYGRSGDLVHVDTGGRARFNFMDWEATRGGAGAGITINLVALLDEIAGVIDPAAAGEGGGGDNAIFRQAHRHMLTNLVALPLLANLPVSLPLMGEVISSAPQSLAQRDNPDWQKQSACWQLLREAEDATRNDPDRRRDFRECRTYFENIFPALSDRFRGSVQMMFSMLCNPFVTSPLARLFAEDTTVRPENTFDGKLIVVDLPPPEFGVAGRMAALAWKRCFQLAVMRRPQSPNNRLVFLWCDEAQNFITEKDAEYQAVARSAGGCTVYLTQQREGIRRVLKSDDATENLLANLQTTFACQNNGQTNEWLSERIGSRYLKITSTNIGRSGQAGNGGGFMDDAGGQAGIQRREEKRAFIESSRFTVLKRGGPQTDPPFCVEAVVYCGGKLFAAPEGGEPLPYKILTFRQR